MSEQIEQVVAWLRWRAEKYRDERYFKQDERRLAIVASLDNLAEMLESGEWATQKKRDEL